MIKITQNHIVDAFCDKMRLLLSTKTGTYNKADPTHFCDYRGSLWVHHGYGEYWQEDYETGETIFVDGKRLHDEPPPIEVKINMHDCTWGIEFTFKTDIGECGAYWSRNFSAYEKEKNPEGGEWVRVKGNFFEVFKDLWLEGAPETPYDECPHGYLAMYE